jgi:hypothetical protein
MKTHYPSPQGRRQIVPSLNANHIKNMRGMFSPSSSGRDACFGRGAM